MIVGTDFSMQLKYSQRNKICKNERAKTSGHETNAIYKQLIKFCTNARILNIVQLSQSTISHRSLTRL